MRAARGLSAIALRLMNSRDDEFAQDTQAMYGEAKRPKLLSLYLGAEHGLDLLFTNADALRRMCEFVRQYVLALAWSPRECANSTQR